MRIGRHIAKQLARVKKIAFGFNGIFFSKLDVFIIVRHGGIINALITACDVVNKVFTDKTVKQRTQYILFKIPTIH